jgi:hypothetical protein
VVEITGVRQTASISETTNIVMRISGRFSDSNDARTAIEELDLEFPRMHQIARRIQNERLQMVSAQLHAHVVFGGFPVETAAALTERDRNADPLASNATRVDGVLERGEEQLLEAARFGSDGMRFELRDKPILRI